MFQPNRERHCPSTVTSVSDPPPPKSARASGVGGKTGRDGLGGGSPPSPWRARFAGGGRSSESDIFIR